MNCIVVTNICFYCSKIHWNERLGDTHSQFPSCHVSVDGTDFRIQEPTPFSSRWFSSKFRGPGVRYEIGISVINPKIIWVNGPFPCGTWPDLRIFKQRMCASLYSGEFVIGDRGYKHVRCITPDDVLPHARSLHDHIRARHETCNERFKRFSILGQVFRHSVQLHGRVFHAVSKIAALAICYEEPLFQL